MTPYKLGLEYQFVAGQYQRRVGAVTNPTPTNPVPGGGTDRPTGAGFVRFEDIYTSGMGSSALALQQVVSSSAAAGKVVTLPEGEWTIGTGGWDGLNDGTYNPALWIKGTNGCQGLIGSGRGTLGGSTGTRIKLAPNTCTNNAICGGAFAVGFPAPSGFTLAQLQVSGTDQGMQTGGTPAAARGNNNGLDYLSPKMFTLVYIYNVPKVLVQDVLVSGWYTSNGAPPGETFGVQVQGTAANADGSNCRLIRVESDGRRAVGGLNYGGGCHVSTTNGAYLEDCWFHHSNAASSFAPYQLFNMQTKNLRIGNSADNDGTAELKKFGGLNHERCGGSVHVNPNIFAASDGKKIHVWHSNDAYTGNGLSAVDGSLTIRNPTFNDVWSNGYLYVETWGPAYGPDANYGSKETNHTAPTVTSSTGANLPYKWLVNGTHYVANSGQYISY